MLEKFPVSQFIPDQEIDQFEIDAQNWICIFCRPTQGRINSPIQIPGLYRKEDVTPYMHVFAKHYKKKNHNQVRLFFGGTTMGGGTDGKSVDSFVSELVINVQVAVPY
ncbi:unnamed protein product [Rhizophagus irregularis]|nr:unnamed protein product [Rhizophagus irregularis]